MTGRQAAVLFIVGVVGLSVSVWGLFFAGHL